MKVFDSFRLPTLGLVGLALVILFGLQGLWEHFVMQPQRLQLQHLNSSLMNLSATRQAHLNSGTKPPSRMDDVLLRLGQQPSIEDRIMKIHVLASEHNVLIRKAAYQKQTKPGTLFQLEIQADLNGSYPAIRQFLRAFLLQDEAAGMGSLDFTRSTAGESVQSQVRLILYALP